MPRVNEFIARCGRCPISLLLAALVLFVVGSPDFASAGDSNALVKFLTPLSGETGNITFKPGLRVQIRYTNDDTDGNNDIRINRVRLKGGGKVFGLAKYYTEIKIDNQEQSGRDDGSAAVENGWLDFTVIPDLAVRAGLGDIPFSRNALTSDSKLLVMDRSLIQGTLAGLGLADNATGVFAHGRPFGGHFEYAGGIFSNEDFEVGDTTEGKNSDELMPVGRIVVHLLDPAPAGGYADYRGSYIGQGQRLALGTNFAYLGNARDGAVGSGEFDLYAWGGDLFFNTGPFTLEAEYDRITKDMNGGSPDLDSDGWYVQGGYLFHRAIEVAARYQELDPDTDVPGDKLRWTTVGLNFYIRQHNLKLQTDYTFKSEQGTGIDNNLFQAQLQLDF